MSVSVTSSMFDPMFDMFKVLADNANATVAKIKAATSDTAEALNTILDTSTDPEVIAWREHDAKIAAQIEKANEVRATNREAIKAKGLTLLPGADADFDVDVAKKEFLTLRQQLTAVRKSLLLLLGNDEEALKAGIEKHGIVEVVGLGRNASGGTAKGASGIKRPRISDASVDGVTVADDKGNVSFTSLTAYISKTFSPVDGDTIRKAAFVAAGTDDLSSLPTGTLVEFTVSEKDNTHAVTVTTKGKPEHDEAADAESDEAESDEAIVPEVPEA